MESGSPAYSKDLAKRKKSRTHWVPFTQASKQQLAFLHSLCGVLLLLSDLSTEEGSSWNVTGGYRGS